MKSKILSLLFALTIALPLSVRVATATEVSCPVTVYFTEQYDTYAEFNWQCYYGVDYVYISPMPNGSRPNWFAGTDYYWGSDWSGYVSYGYWQPYFSGGCDWVLAGIYDVWLAQIPSTPSGHTYRLTVNYDDSSSWSGDLGGTGTSINFSDIQAYVTDARAVSASAVEKINVTLQSVTGADSIGTSGGVNIYATTNATGQNVTIQLAVSPSDASVSVSWSGGSAGATGLQRLVSRTDLQLSGVTVTATVCGTTVFNGKVYVFPGTPTATGVTLNQTITRDDSIVPSNAFGLTDHFAGSVNPVYGIYYSGGKWKYVFSTLNYTSKWGMHSMGNGDVTNPAANPFPLGAGMSESSSEYTKKSTAKTDLNPHGSGQSPFYNGEPNRFYYWTSGITQQHEFYHIVDYKNNYFTAKMQEAETWIEAQEDTVTTSNIDIVAALTSKTSAFFTKINDKYEEGKTSYQSSNGHEDRAYLSGKADYQTLSNSITP